MANGINPVQNDGVYAKFNDLPKMQYRILDKLINNEDLWKLLNYDSPDAFYKNNLTIAQKSALIYQPVNNAYPQDTTKYKVFLTAISDDMWSTEGSVVRVLPPIMYPNNRTVGDLIFPIEVFTHVKIDPLEGGMSRVVCMASNIIGTLNGAEIEATGKLAFDRMSNTMDKAVLSLSNDKTFMGYEIYLSTHYQAG